MRVSAAAGWGLGAGALLVCGMTGVRAEQAQAQAQAVMGTGLQSSAAADRPPRRLTGRFMHITDIHPDPYYLAGASFSTGCHRMPDKGKGKGTGSAPSGREDGAGGAGAGTTGKDKDESVAGRWGSAVSDCDSPLSLVNVTFDWIKKEWANEVDFVVWTGDNARHDIDREQPRTPREIYALNRMMAAKMRESFGREVVVVPSIGNNDIYPHNILEAGPSAVTNEFTSIWSNYIPSDDYHVFQRGAYYSAEVIPDRLAVISLNTLYWYDSNKAVDGCRDGSDEPGALEFDWLEVQLESFRARGMQVWLTGHVPPHQGHYFRNCYLRYGELSLRYQDTIVGHLYGHMNMDHFFFLDYKTLDAGVSFQSSKLDSGSLPDALLRDFGDVPAGKKMKAEDYVVVNVAPSVIPTYLPGIRVFSYNVTDLDLDDDDFKGAVASDASSWFSSWLTKKKHHGKKKKHGKGRKHKKKKKKPECSRPEYEDTPHCKFRYKERYASADSPSRTNTLFSPLGYAQFYIPDLDNQKRKPMWELEYTTYTEAALLANGSGAGEQASPVPLHLLPNMDEDAAGSKAAMSKITPFKLEDLTIPSYAAFARRLAANKGSWDKFKQFMFVSSDKDDKK